MEFVYLTVILLLNVKYDMAEECVYEDNYKCNELVKISFASVCYNKKHQKALTATVTCNQGILNGTKVYTCKNNGNWDSPQDSVCIQETTSRPSQSTITTTPSSSITKSQNPSEPSTNSLKTSTETSSTVTATSTETTEPTSQHNSSETVTNQTHISLETSTRETAGTSLRVNTSDTPSSSVPHFKTETSTYRTTGTSLSVNTSGRTTSSAPPFTADATKTTASKPTEGKSIGSTTDGEYLSRPPVEEALDFSGSDDNGPVVAVAVSVSVVTVILVVLVVAFLLWRKRRQKSIPSAKLHTGNSFTNRSYEESHGLDRHISLLNIRSSQSVDSGYAEITLENLRSEETSGNVYQTIDSLPENQTACNGNYGHLKMKTTAFVDNNYSHIPINQANGNIKQDSTYAHTGGATLKPDMEDKRQYSENTYNILETMHNMTTRVQKMDKQQESSTDDDESEYNHATAERSESSPESKADTYSHLNRTWQNQRANSRNDMKPIVEGSENQSHYSKADKSDNGKANLRKNNPEYAKCVKKMEDTENRRQVGSDGYEKASGVAHEYFILEPDNDTADKETSFHVIEDNFGDKPDDTEDAENPYHQYFTLERQINN